MIADSRERFIARIATQQDAGRPPAGVGVVVGESHLITCAHVVNSALNRNRNATEAPPETARVLVQLPLLDGGAGEAALCKVAAWVPPSLSEPGSGDIAGLLVVEGKLPAAAGAARLTHLESIDRDRRADLFGYPGDPPRKQLGAWAACIVRGAVGGGAVQLDQAADASIRGQPGFSGSPVVVHDASGDTVVGILVTASRDDAARDSYAIPVSRLITAWPDVLTGRDLALSPYRGLLPFTEQDSRDGLFVGRDEEAAAIARLLDREQAVLVVGPSGVGKSSLVDAGIRPRFETEGWRVASFRPGQAPLLSVARALFEVDRPEQPPSLQELDERNRMLAQDGLASVVNRLAVAADKKVLLVVDQLEELFATDAQEAADFLAQLFPLLDVPFEKWRVLATVRADFYPRLLESPQAAERIRDRQFPLSPMPRDRLVTIVSEPAARRGVIFEEGLPERIADDADRGRGGLPLLQFALSELWPRQRGGQIRHADYEAIGRVEGALSRHATEVVDGLGVEVVTIRRLLLALVRSRGGAVQATRRTASRAEFTEAEWNLLTRMADRRLLVVGVNDGVKQTVELAHEELVRSWDRMRAWVDEDAEFQRWLVTVEDRAEQDDPLGGSLLAAAENWVERRGGDIRRDVLAFIKRSLSARDERIAGELERELAVRVSESLRLASQARDLGPVEPETALRLALEAADWDQNELTDTVLRESLARASYPVQILSAEGTDRIGFDACQTSAGDLAVAGIRAGTVQVWPAGPHGIEVSHLIRVPGSRPTRVAPAGDERALLTHRDGVLRLHDVAGDALASCPVAVDVSDARLSASGRLAVLHDREDAWLIAFDAAAGSISVLRPLLLKRPRRQRGGTGHEGHMWSVNLNRAGSRILSEGDDSTVRLWSIDGVQQAVLRDEDGRDFASAQFLPDGRIVTGTLHGRGQLWSAEGEPLNVFRTPDSETYDLWIDAIHEPTGRFAGHANQSSAIWVWNQDGTLLATLHGHEGEPRCLAFSSDGGLLASGASDSTVRLWELDGANEPVVLHGHRATVSWVAFDPVRPDVLLSADHDGSLRRWTLSELPNPVWRGHTEAATTITHVAGLLVTAGREETLLWTGSGESRSLGGALMDRATFADGQGAVVTRTNQGDLSIWRLAADRELPPAPARTVPADALLAGRSEEQTADRCTIGARGDALVVVADGHARLVRASDSRPVLLRGENLVSHPNDRVEWVATHPESGDICTASKAGMVWFWGPDGAPQGSVVAERGGASDEILTFGMSVADNRVHVGGRRRARLLDWRTHDGPDLPVAGYKVFGIHVSPTGDRVVTVSDNPGDGPSAYFELWNSTGDRLCELSVAHPHAFARLAFATDGTFFGVEDGEGATVFDRDGNRLGKLSRNTKTGVGTIVASPAEAGLACYFTDGIVRLWDGHVNRATATVSVGEVTGVGFSPDGRGILAAKADGSLQRHLVLTDDMMIAAAARVGRPLSGEECERFDIPAGPRIDRVTLARIADQA